MGALLVCLAAMSAFLAWPINRWASRGDGSIRLFGFAANVTVAGLSLAFVAITREPSPGRATLVLSGLGGLAIVIGYWTLLLRALRIGPAGPTIAIYNMGLLWPVVVGSCVLVSRALHPLILAGVALVVAALGISVTGALAAGEQAQGATSRRWLALSLAGWVVGGWTMTLLMAAQLGSRNATGHICLVYASVAALLLAPGASARAGRHVRPCDVLGGAAAGLLMFVNSVAVLAALRWVGPQIVYTVPTVVPIILMLAVGHVAYRERLTARGWATCLVGACAVVALAVGTALAPPAGAGTHTRTLACARTQLGPGERRGR